MPVPGVVAADLVVVQAGLVLGGLEAFLDRPPGPGHGDQLGQGGAGRGVAGEERQLPAGDRAADQQLTGGAGGGDQRPVIEPGSLGAVAAGQLLPPGGAAPGAARSSARRGPAAVAAVKLFGTAST